MKVFEVGGQEVVTATLADQLVRKGFHVVIASFKTPNPLMVQRTNPDIKFYTIGDFSYNKNTVSQLRRILESNHIDITINQWGLPYIPCKVLNKAKEGLGIKTIAVYHNSPDNNARIKDVEISLEEKHGSIGRLVLQLKKLAFKEVTSRSMKYVYDNTDLYVVLSPSYIRTFEEFTGVRNPSHLVAIPNPVTVDAKSYTYHPENKRKEIVYIGRIDYNQKRVSRIIDVWNILEKEHPDWKLTIVGDGVSRKDVEEQAKDLQLHNISFEGFKRPEEYYRRASILLLTSEYEGFPLVLPECMSYGVVPVVYDSFAAIHDIIDNNENGVIIPKVEGYFDKNQAATLLSSLMNSPERLEKMAEKAMEKSKTFALDMITEQWISTFNKLM